ncbi:helix-turn-helix domain-containing protein [Yersinia enterocolitica]|uniref:helix-turn-helix domain-containing protein n=1 Tax=Yersinia enterocolitica TaxID=630 RepID=UPI0037D0F225
MEKNETIINQENRTIASEAIVRFSERLKEAMNGMSNHALARQSGLSEAAIRKYIKGDSYPTIDNAAKVADACGVTLMWLLTGDDCGQLLQQNPPDITNKETHRANKNHYNSARNALSLMLNGMSSEDIQTLFLALCNIGIKGVLGQLKHIPNSTMTIKDAIQALDIRESLKEAIYVALDGNEEIDREILQSIKSLNRGGPPGDNTVVTPEQENDSVGKKLA